MKFLHKWSLGLMLAALPLFTGCESDSANAADIEMSSTAAVTSPPSMTVATASEVSTAVGVSADMQSPDATTMEQSLPAGVDPASALASVIKLAQAGMSESVILSYISNSAAPFNLTSDQMIYLRDLGLSDTTINVMLQRDQAFAGGQSPPPTAAVATAPLTPPAEVVQTVPTDTTYTYFYDSLSPYGSWVFVTDYGWCWQPTVVAINRGWQPYCDSGHWVYTDCGWYWSSDYSWGWAPFHYGRWFRHPSRGWCWTPGHEWAPSWVSWRHNNDYCGWAPLPPGAVFRPGIGLTFHGRHVDANFNFGLNVDLFTFVPSGRFTDRHPGRFRAGRGQDTRIYNNTTVINNIVVGNNNTIINRGIGTERVERATHTTIRPVHVESRDDRNPRNGRHEQFNPGGNTLVVNRPSLRDHAPDAVNNQRPGGSRNTPSDNQRRDRNGDDNNRSPSAGGNNPPANNVNPSDRNQRERDRDNTRVVNGSPNNQRTTPAANDNNPRSSSNGRTRPNQGNTLPANNTPSGVNNVPPNQNPSGPRNNPPRTAAPSVPATAPASAPATAPGTRVTAPGTRVTAPSVPVTAPSTRVTAPSTPTTTPSPIVRPDRGQQNQPNNQRPIVTTPTPTPRVQTPAVNPAANPRTFVPGNQNQSSRYNSPRVESQVVPPRAPQQVQPTFPRQERPAVSAPTTSSGGGRSEGRSSGGQGSRSGGGDRSGSGNQSGSDQNRRNR